MTLLNFLICGMRCLDCEDSDVMPQHWSYDAVLEDRLRSEAVYVLMDRDTYAAHKCDVNLLELYEQEIRVRKAAVLLLRHKSMLDSRWLGQIQWLQSEVSRFEFLADALYEDRIRRSPAALNRRHQRA